MTVTRTVPEIEGMGMAWSTIARVYNAGPDPDSSGPVKAWLV